MDVADVVDVVDVAAAADPAEAVLAAHRSGQRVALTTSGSAGRSRRVVRTTRSWVGSFPVVARLTGLEAASRMWLPGRPGTTLSLFAEVLAQHTGASRVTRAEDATHAHLTPGQLERALEGLAVARSSGPVHVTVAGDSLPAALRARAEAVGIRVSHYYGAAELSFVAWGDGAGGLRPFPGVEVDVRDGEVWARSPYLADGYLLSMPPEVHTGPAGSCPADLGGALRTDADGFATVGDRGRWVGEGDGRVLVVTGRGDDAVTTGAATVLVADVEAVLRPVVVGGVAVVGVPHGSLGHVLAAVLTDPADLDAAHAAAEVLAAAHRPRLWFHRRELPIAASGKTDRAALRDEAAALPGSRDPGGPDVGGPRMRRLVPGRTR